MFPPICDEYTEEDERQLEELHKSRSLCMKETVLRRQHDRLKQETKALFKKASLQEHEKWLVE